MMVFYLQRLIESMDNMTIDAFVYPGWGNPPRLIGDLQQSGNTPLGTHAVPALMPCRPAQPRSVWMHPQTCCTELSAIIAVIC